MDINEFINKCVDTGYSWKVDDVNEGYLIGSEKFDTITHFTTDAIKNTKWARLNKGIVRGKDVRHMSRVVGYYSYINNWNESKKGELLDRQKGNYSIGGQK